MYCTQLNTFSQSLSSWLYFAPPLSISTRWYPGGLCCWSKRGRRSGERYLFIRGLVTISYTHLEKQRGDRDQKWTRSTQHSRLLQTLFWNITATIYGCVCLSVSKCVYPLFLSVTDPQGLVRISSWMLCSPSDTDWLSCTVSLSEEEKKESRILPKAPTEGENLRNLNQYLII